MENSKISLGNFVEQVAGQKQEVSMVDFSTENPKMDLHDDDLGLIKLTEDRFECVDAWIQNTESEVTHGCKFSYTLLARKNLGVRKISVKRRYHRARYKRGRKKSEHQVVLSKISMKKNSATMDSSWCNVLSHVNKVCVEKEHLSSLSWSRCVWEPGGILAERILWDWLVSFNVDEAAEIS